MHFTVTCCEILEGHTFASSFIFFENMLLIKSLMQRNVCSCNPFSYLFLRMQQTQTCLFDIFHLYLNNCLSRKRFFRIIQNKAVPYFFRLQEISGWVSGANEYQINTFPQTKNYLWRKIIWHCLSFGICEMFQ